MILDAASQQIRTTVSEMNARYGGTVFNEWAILLFREGAARILAYNGPRREDFQKRFTEDLGTLRQELTSVRYNVGDFEFARHAVGTQFETFMLLAPEVYLICNNTSASMDQIAKEPRWLNAQVPFAELGEKFRADPLTVTN